MSVSRQLKNFTKEAGGSLEFIKLKFLVKWTISKSVEGNFSRVVDGCRCNRIGDADFDQKNGRLISRGPNK